MAGHLPIEIDITHTKIVSSFKKKHKIKELDYFKRIQHGKGKMYRLPLDEFNMDDETGLVDDEVIALEYEDKIIEYHLNKNQKLHQVYLVM